MEWELAGERGIIFTLPGSPCPTLTETLLALRESLKAEFGGAITDAVPGYVTLAVFFNPEQVNRDTLVQSALATSLEADTTSPTPPENSLCIPIYYHPEVAPDLEPAAHKLGISVASLIEQHSGNDYFAFANGFAPGFCYLGELPGALTLPRRATPRHQVAAGSLAIAERQTAIYPSASPGGWHVIGRCPLPLFNPESMPVNRVNVGDWVRFEPIDRSRFLGLGGLI